MLSVRPPDMVLPRVAAFAHFGQLVFVLRVHALEHRRVLHHVGDDHKPDLAAADVDVAYDALLARLHHE